mgnify:CR=1 FL=1
MATINEITSGSSYTGSKELGGFIPTAIEIDTKPLQTLAAYTVMQNRSFYDQRVKDADAKIKELADLSQYDITNARGKDKELAITMFVDLQKKMKDYAQKGVPTNPQEKIQQELELKTSVKEATDKIKSLNARGIAYNARLNAINKEDSTGEIKSVKKKQLDEEFDAGSWDTPIAAEEKFTANLPKIGAPVYTKNVTSVDLGNKIIQQEVQFFNPAKNLDNATADVLGFQNNTLPANATPEQRRQFELGQASGGQAKVLTDAATFLNSALADPKYRNEDGTINQEAVASDNRIAASVLNGIDRYNKYAEDLKQDIRNGFYTTKLGKKIDLLNIVNESDVFTIDKNKPLSTEQIVFIQKFLDAAPDTKDEKIIETDDNIQQQQIEIAKRGAAVNEGQLKLDRDKWNASQVGGETVKNGAWVFAESLYGDLSKLADKNGVISPDKLRQLNVEQLKYLGVEVPDEIDEETGKVIKGGYRPLDLSPTLNDKGKVKSRFAIQLVNGEVKVLEDAKPLGDGRFVGELNNTKTTNIRNIATNRLNEELKNSGSKEVNTYLGVDVTQSGTSNTIGGSTSSSASSSNRTASTVRVQGANGKVYSVPAGDVDAVLKQNKGAKIIQ